MSNADAPSTRFTYQLLCEPHGLILASGLAESEGDAVDVIRAALYRMPAPSELFPDDVANGTLRLSIRLYPLLPRSF